MKSLSPKTKQYLLAVSMLGSTAASTWCMQTAGHTPVLQQNSVVVSEQEIAYMQELTNKINALFDDIVKLVLDFVDDNNQESYNIHIQKFANKIQELQNNILLSIDTQRPHTNGPLNNALTIARNIVQEMLNKITAVHNILVKHRAHKNAINLKSDLEPVIQQMTSQEMANDLDNKLVQLHKALLDAGHAATAHKINEVRLALKKAKASYDAQKVSPKMLAVLRNRLRRK